MTSFKNQTEEKPLEEYIILFKQEHRGKRSAESFDCPGWNKYKGAKFSLLTIAQTELYQQRVYKSIHELHTDEIYNLRVEKLKAKLTTPAFDQEFSRFNPPFIPAGEADVSGWTSEHSPFSRPSKSF